MTIEAFNHVTPCLLEPQMFNMAVQSPFRACRFSCCQDLTMRRDRVRSFRQLEGTARANIGREEFLNDDEDNNQRFQGGRHSCLRHGMVSRRGMFADVSRCFLSESLEYSLSH